MKKLISILVIVAMMLASVLAMIPASAAKVSDTALATFNVNWKNLYDADTMETRWVYDPEKSNYEDHYTVTATENSITSVAKDTNADNLHLSYYSRTMFKITENTYYEYDFKAKNFHDNPTGYAGVVFAYAKDNDAYVESGDKGDQTDIEGTYFLYGAFQNESDDGDKFALDVYFGYYGNKYCVNPGSIANGVAKEESATDRYVTYKVVYDGYDVTFYYVDANGDYVQFFADLDLTLPEESAVCFGMYNRGKARYVHIKDAVLTAYNYESAAIINGVDATKGDLAEAIDLALDRIASDKYVADTENALNTAVNDAKVVLNNTEADANAIADAIAAIENVTLTLKATADDKAALQASLTTAATLTEQPDTATPEEWTAFEDAKAAAQNVHDNAEASKADVENAKSALDDAYALATAYADTTALAAAIATAKEKAEADYTKASWDAFAAKLAVAEGLAATADQTAVDTAKNELETAMGNLVEAAENLGALKTAYDAAALITEKPATATDPAWNAFTAARDAANDLLTARSDNEDVVASATTTLDGAQRLLDPRINVMGDSDKDKQWAGTGNVFYYDYYKYIAAKNWDGTSAFPTVTGNDQGDSNYMLRLGNNNGGGTASVCDGTKDSGGLTHHVGDVSINDTNYKHAFGYSFKERVTVDSVKFYLPTDTAITSIDVYGAVRSENGGTVVYGKDADKVFLGRFAVGAAEAGAANIVAGGALSEAYSVDYIFFAVNGPSGTYKFYEIELYGILNGADYSALKAAIATAKEKVEADYTAQTWADFAAALTAANAVNKSSLSTQVDVNAAAAALTTATGALAAKPVDKTALAASIADAEALKQADYVSTSWTALADALADAKATNESATATQSKIDADKAALDAAVAALVKRGDKTELKALIEEYKALKEADWQGNPTAWTMFVKGIEAAEALCENADASEADVAGMLTDLKDRKAKLIASTGNEGAEGDAPSTDAPADDAETEAPAGDAETEAPADDAETEAPADDETKAAKKGCGSSIALSALAVIGVVGTALVIKKKED